MTALDYTIRILISDIDALKTLVAGYSVSACADTGMP